MLLGIVLAIWSLTPIYSMVMVALQPHGDVFSSSTYPVHPSFLSFWIVLSEGYWYWSISGTSSATASTWGR